jgi:hypothetical protein
MVQRGPPAETAIPRSPTPEDRAHAGGLGSHRWGIAARQVLAAPWWWLAVAAAAPFAPGALQFLHRGIADVLFDGDAAALELGTLHAAHGTQLLGPYSRFQWNHPGPAFFYLALPVYEAFHRRGPAIDLFAFLTNLGCAMALVLSARRLAGVAFALAVALLLACYLSVGPEFQLSSEWNPLTPVLPLCLSSLLCARIALGHVRAVPAFAFVASAIVQTHVGYLPVVAVLVLLASTLPSARRLLRRRRGPASDQRDVGPVLRSVITPACLTLGALVLVWWPPVLDCWAHPPGNLVLLWRFFTAPHAPDHVWRVVFETAARGLAHLPVALLRAFGAPGDLRAWVFEWTAGGLAFGAVLAAVYGWVQGDAASGVLAAVALGEMVAAVVAVRSIRGPIFPYLVAWTSVGGWMALVAIARAAFVAIEPHARRAFVRPAFVVATVAGLLFCVRAEAAIVDVYRAHDPELEQFAHEVRAHLAANPGRPPLLRIAVHDTWPTAIAVVLYLFKTDVPFFVSSDWLFMMGREFAPPDEDRPILFIGDGAFCEMSLARPDRRLLSAVPRACAFLGDPRYLEEHRIAAAGALVAATGVRGDPTRAVDTVVPPEGERWDSPLSVVLESTASVIEVALPSSSVAGVLLSVDTGDVYSVECRRDDGAVVELGKVTATSRTSVGVGTVPLFTEALRSCRSVLVSPVSGDGYYSVGEIGFLRP